MQNKQKSLTSVDMYAYRQRYRLALSAVVLASLVGAVLLVVLTIMTISRPQAKYFATTTTGRVIPLQSLNMPVVTTAYLLQWSQMAVRACYNLKFSDYQQQLKVAQGYFTPTGWQSFNSALKSSGVLDSLKQNKLFMSAVIDGPPVIRDRAIIGGRFTWYVQVPLLVTYNSASEQRQAHFIISLTVMRVPVLDIAKGIAINNFSVFRSGVK